ncbi:MAG: hypothetical protein M1812_001359 [Candelaria pacifica]|nr:MAG: hypothetical protein M1812_001359 [Candelaria pacifica]
MVTRPVCLRSSQANRVFIKSTQSRTLSTSSAVDQEVESGEMDRRWAQTPQRMRAPVRARPKPQSNNFRVNEDPKQLEQIMGRVLGSGGEKMLTEEVRWLVVTHKSFDHGRRGFNDRLAFLGKRIVDLESSLAIVNSPMSTRQSIIRPSEDPYGRKPFKHVALDGLANLTEYTRYQTLDIKRLAQLAERYGLTSVIRWKPKKADNMKGSGIDVVLNSALYAIVGATALQKGGKVASKIVRERILTPLGVV